jgi:hypothetical protein
MLAALPAVPNEPEARPHAWTMPPSWWSLAAAGAPLLHRVRGDGDVQLLLDGSGQLALASWRGETPAAVEALLQAHDGRAAAPQADATADVSPAPSVRPATRRLPPRDPLEVVLTAWTTATARWLRRYAGIGLSGLVRRPGRVSWTRTHIDMIFHLSQTDLDVRRAGLDINPGWVPWLGRVISFHYVDEDDARG